MSEEKNSAGSDAEEQISLPTTKSSSALSLNSDDKDKGTPWHIIIPVGIAVISLISLVGFLI